MTIVSAPPIAQRGATAMLGIGQPLDVYMGPPIPGTPGIYVTLSPDARFTFTLSRSAGGMTQPVFTGDHGAALNGRVAGIGSADGVSVRLSDYAAGSLTLSIQS